MEDNVENKYKITDKQEKLLKSFQCIRLKDYDFSNGYNFISKRNKNISDTFNNYGLEEDREGESAYYVIFREEKIALFFSIKCGSLFDKPIFDIINDLIENRENDYDDDIEKIAKKIEAIKDEIKKESNKNIKRVSNTYSAIELVLFCINDNYKEQWEKIKIDYDIFDKNTMGKTFFWYYIVPIIIDINKIIGSKYVYLFAADSSNDETLIRYYEDINFKRDTEFATIKPYYDFSCIFMYQEISDLIKKREEYLNRFNEDEKSILENEDGN